MAEEVLSQHVQRRQVSSGREPSERKCELKLPNGQRALVGNGSNEDCETCGKLLITKREDEAFDNLFALSSGELAMRLRWPAEEHERFDPMVYSSYADGIVLGRQTGLETVDDRSVRLV